MKWLIIPLLGLLVGCSHHKYTAKIHRATSADRHYYQKYHRMPESFANQPNSFGYHPQNLN